MTMDPDGDAAQIELDKKCARNEYKRCRMKFNRTIDSSLVAVSLHVCMHRHQLKPRNFVLLRSDVPGCHLEEGGRGQLQCLGCHSKEPTSPVRRFDEVRSHSYPVWCDLVATIRFQSRPHTLTIRTYADALYRSKPLKPLKP